METYRKAHKSKPYIFHIGDIVCINVRRKYGPIGNAKKQAIRNYPRYKILKLMAKNNVIVRNLDTGIELKIHINKLVPEIINVISLNEVADVFNETHTLAPPDSSPLPDPAPVNEPPGLFRQALNFLDNLIEYKNT